MKYIFVMIISLSIAQYSFAVSFDCKNASNNIEKSICNNNELSDLDDVMSIVYKNLNQNDISIKNNQKNWISHRNKCEDLNCIKKSYLGRLNNLLAISDKTMNYYNEKQYEFGNKKQNFNRLINISNKTTNKFNFDISVYNSFHTGDLSGTATYYNNYGIFKDNEGCKLVFVNKNNEVDVYESNCLMYHGVGVTFSGEYYSDDNKYKKYNLFESGIIDNSGVDKSLQLLTGYYYDTFLDNMQMITNEKNIDNFDAKVIVGRVKNNPELYSAIIMYDDNGFIAAATTDFTNNQKNIRYFTNSPSLQKNSYPETIKKWISATSVTKTLIMIIGNDGYVHGTNKEEIYEEKNDKNRYVRANLNEDAEYQISSHYPCIKFYVETGTFGDINDEDILIPEGISIAGTYDNSYYRFRLKSDVVLKKNETEKYVDVILIQGPIKDFPPNVLTTHDFTKYKNSNGKKILSTNVCQVRFTVW